MSFSKLTHNHELAYITKLLAIFGVVERDQMRKLFSHLTDSEYGKILTRLHREGLAYRSPDSVYLASSKFTADRVDKSNSVMCFWAFIVIKDKVHDFCAGEAPTIITVAAKSKDYDLIPLNGKNTQQVNEAGEEIPSRTIRYLITKDLQLITSIDRRMKNDYVIHVGDEGVIDIYEL